MRLHFALSCFLFMNACTFCQPALTHPTLSGRWEGSVRVPGSPIRFVIDLAQHDRQWIGSLIAPDFGIEGAPLTGITVEGRNVEFALKHVLGDPSFKAHLEADGTLEGQYIQGGNRAGLTLKRLGDPQVELSALGTFVSKELQGEWRGSVEFAGSKFNLILKLPDSGAPDKPTGQFVIVENNATSPIAFWKEDGKNIVFTIEEFGGLTFVGEFLSVPPEIKGEIQLHQGNAELPLAMRPAPPNAADGKPAAVITPN
jgi:hypothetical protein